AFLSGRVFASFCLSLFVRRRRFFAGRFLFLLCFRRRFFFCGLLLSFRLRCWSFAGCRRGFEFFRRHFPCFRLWFWRRRRRRRFLFLVRRSFWLRCRARRFVRR